MGENHQDKTESKPTATDDKSQLPLLTHKDEEVAQEDEKRAQKELNRLHDNRLEDTIEHLRDRGYKVTTEYSGDTLEQLSKVRLALPPRKTWWDWLQLLIIPLLIAGLGIGFTWVQNQTSLQIANNQQQETILQTYLDNMSDLLLNKDLSKSRPGEAVSEVARERTLTTLRRLDAKHNKIVLRFLQDAHLVGIQDAVINLNNADLSNDDLSGINLSGIDLSGDNFNDSHLHGTDLYGSNLIGATLGSADLSSADLSEALLTQASLNSAHLNSAHLNSADLSGADLSNADLSEALLSDTILNGADLSNATLNGAHLNSADLSNATLSGADLSGADLSNATLNGASNLIQQQLDTVSSCANADSLPTGLTCPHSGSMVTLTYWYTESTAETPVILRLIKKFEQQNPDIQINYVYKPFLQAQAAFITAAQAGHAPDVLRSAVDWVTPFASQHYLLNIDSYISKSHLDLSDYLSAPLSYDQYNGHLYGLPQVTDFLALLYNWDEFRKAGITSPPATMADFEAAAMKVVQSKAAKYGFETTGTSYYVLPFLWAFGGGMIDQHNNILVNNDGSVAGLNFLLKLQNSDKVMPAQVDFSNGTDKMVSDFMSGQTAMIFDGPWDVSKILTGSAFKGNPSSNLGIAAVPMDLSGDQPRSPAGGQSYVISADTAHPAEAYKFISFMSSTTSQVAIAQVNHTLPTRKSAYQDRSLAGNARIIKAFYDILPTAHARPAIPRGGYLFDAFDPNIVAALDGAQSPIDALNAVADAWKQLLASS